MIELQLNLLTTSAKSSKVGRALTLDARFVVCRSFVSPSPSSWSSAGSAFSVRASSVLPMPSLEWKAPNLWPIVPLAGGKAWGGFAMGEGGSNLLGKGLKEILTWLFSWVGPLGEIFPSTPEVALLEAFTETFTTCTFTERFNTCKIPCLLLAFQT